MTDGNDLQQIGDADDIDGLLGAYVLDALGDGERRRVEAYLAVNPAARAEVDRLASSFDEVVVEGVAELAPPAALWDRIAGSLPPRPERLPQADADEVESGPVEPVPASTGAAAPTIARSPEPQPEPEAGAGAGAGDELADRRAAKAKRSTSTTTRIILSVAAAVIVVVVGLAVVRQTSTKSTSLAAQIQKDADAAANAPGSKTATLTGATDASVKVVVDESGRGFVIPENLPALPDGSTYQLWSVVDGTPVSLGILGSDPNVTVVATGPDPSTMAITAEPAGGSPAPTSPILVSGNLT